LRMACLTSSHPQGHASDLAQTVMQARCPDPSQKAGTRKGEDS